MYVHGARPPRCTEEQINMDLVARAKEVNEFGESMLRIGLISGSYDSLSFGAKLSASWSINVGNISCPECTMSRCAVWAYKRKFFCLMLSNVLCIEGNAGLEFLPFSASSAMVAWNSTTVVVMIDRVYTRELTILPLFKLLTN